MPPDPNILVLLDWLQRKTQEIRSLCPEAPARVETLKTSATAPVRDLHSGHRLDLGVVWGPFAPTILLSPESAEENPFFDGKPAAFLGLFEQRREKARIGFMHTSNRRTLAYLYRSWIDTDGIYVADHTAESLPILPSQARSLIRLFLEADAPYGPASERIRRQLLKQVRAQAA